MTAYKARAQRKQYAKSKHIELGSGAQRMYAFAAQFIRTEVTYLNAGSACH